MCRSGKNFSLFAQMSTMDVMMTVPPLPDERRSNKMFVTRNTEYYLRDRLCLAVRDRRTATWLEGHLAVGSTLFGALRVLPSGEAVPTCEWPKIGDALYFSEPGRELITSTLCGIERAQPELVLSHAE